MQFLKKHYEKIILSMVLLALAAATAFMSLKVSKEKANEEARQQDLIAPKVKPFPPIDLSTNQITLARLNKPRPVSLAGEHNLFNPVIWERTPDGTLRKRKAGTQGVSGIVVTAIQPLSLVVSLDEVSGTTAENAKYMVSILRETDKQPRKVTRAVGPKAKNASFEITAVQGAPENPDSLILKLEGEKAPITISREKPFTKVIGYAADIRYDAENLIKKGLKVKDAILVGGEIYNIIAINPSEVVVSARSNLKQTSIKYSQQQ